MYELYVGSMRVLVARSFFNNGDKRQAEGEQRERNILQLNVKKCAINRNIEKKMPYIDGKRSFFR